MPEAVTDCLALSVSAESPDTAPSTTYHTPLSFQGRHPIDQRTSRSNTHRRKKTRRTDNDSVACGSSSGVGRNGCRYPCTLLCSGLGYDGGSAAEIATERKNSKYSELVNTHFFVPIALETLGPINVAGPNFL